MTGGQRYSVGLVLLIVLAVTAIHGVGDRGNVLGVERSGEFRRETSSHSSRRFPRSVTDKYGNLVTIPAPPRRIVSAEMTVDEILFDLIGPERIFAVSQFSFERRYSSLADRVTDLDLPSSESAEVVLSLRPDLVITGTHVRAEWLDLLRRADVPVYRLEHNLVKLSQIGGLIRRIGYLTGADDRAGKLVKLFQERVEHAQKRRPPHATSRPRILGYDRSLSLSYGSNTLFHDVVTTLGGINVGAERGLDAYDGISFEQIAAWNPEWIVTGADPDRQEAVRQALLANPGVAATSAARNGKLLILPQEVFLSMSHNVIQLVEDLSAALYPEDA